METKTYDVVNDVEVMDETNAERFCFDGRMEFILYAKHCKETGKKGSVIWVNSNEYLSRFMQGYRLFEDMKYAKALRAYKNAMVVPYLHINEGKYMQKQDYQTLRSIVEIENYIGNATVIAFDFETSPNEPYRETERAALDPYMSDITGISLSVKPGTGRYIPLRHRTGENADIQSVMSYLTTRVFQHSSMVKIAHNLAFEAMFLYKYGIVLRAPLYDTIVASQLTLKSDSEFRELSDSGLKTLVPYLYGVELPKFEEVVGERHFDELDPEAWDTCRYACADSDYALQLYHTFNAWFENNIPRHRYICEAVESPTAAFTGLMKYNGIGVDIQRMSEKKAEAEAHIVELRARLQAVIGAVEIGENCGTQAFKVFANIGENMGLGLGNGRVSVVSITKQDGYCEIGLEITAEPYKLEQTETSVSRSKNGTVTLKNGRMPVVPTITNTQEATITFTYHGASVQATLAAGTHTVPTLVLGENETKSVTVASTGKTTFKFRKGAI